MRNAVNIGISDAEQSKKWHIRWYFWGWEGVQNNCCRELNKIKSLWKQVVWGKKYSRKAKGLVKSEIKVKKK